jgi:predicted double-glycine peptidase
VRPRGLLLAALLLAPLLVPGGALAGRSSVILPGGRGGGGTVFGVPVRTLVDLRFENVVRQAYDLSCGAAALATLLKYFYDEDLTERQIIERILLIGDAEKIQRDGFSMLELKQYSEERGYQSQGFRIDDVESLAQLRVPVLALTSVRGYSHFVVIKGVVDGQVFLADPAFGNRSLSLERFEREWNNIILVVLSGSRQGNSTFATRATLMAPMSQVKNLLDHGVRPITPRPGEF